MTARKTNISRKHTAIKKRFAELSAKTTQKGKKLLTYAAIVEQLQKEFYLAENTVEKIICR